MPYYKTNLTDLPARVEKLENQIKELNKAISLLFDYVYNKEPLEVRENK